MMFRSAKMSPNSRLHADEQLRGAYGAPPLLAGEANVMRSHGVSIKHPEVKRLRMFKG